MFVINISCSTNVASSWKKALVRNMKFGYGVRCAVCYFHNLKWFIPLFYVCRFERILKRRSADAEEQQSLIVKKPSLNMQDEVIEDCSEGEEVKSRSVETQVDFADRDEELSTHPLLFMCNRTASDTACHAETQMNSPNLRRSFKMEGTKAKTRDACCGNSTSYEDKSTGFENDLPVDCNSGFQGISSLKSKSDREILDLTGVTHKAFALMLKVLSKHKVDGIKISQENRLLIFLMKMKCGLTFSALSVLFNVHRSTVSRIFFATVQYLASACRNFVLWPTRDTVQATMPQSFKTSYANCRAIIDCTEIVVEQPPTVELRVQFYSHYKKGFRLKILVACTPCGLISFVSKCFGGRTTDSQITTTSGFLTLLEPGDVILADKGFPQIKSLLDESGRGVLIVMPPFLHNHTFTAEEVSDTYSIASVRIHIERIMQRLRTFKILDKMTINMLPYSDDIVFMCCVLVNLQPPIIKESDSVHVSEC